MNFFNCNPKVKVLSCDSGVCIFFFSPRLGISFSFLIREIFLLRYFNYKPSFKLRWCCDRDLFGSQILVITGGFKLQISCIGSSFQTH